MGRGLIAFLERDTLRYIFHFDPRFRRVLQRNYMSCMLSGVRRFVPMLNDMEQRSLMILSTLISMKQMKSGEIIYKKGQNGEFCYIIVKGLVKVRWY